MTGSSAAQRPFGSELRSARQDAVARPFSAGSRSGELLFAALACSYCIIYLLYYPASYSILDESSTLGLSYALAHGTIYLDRVDLTTGLTINGHIVSLYSPFHASLLAICMMSRWRLGFVVTAIFFLLGASTVRGMLKRENLSSGWSFLYFLNPGALYYSQTLMAAIPAASMGLLGVALLMRQSPRIVLGGLALGCAVLLHPLMGPFAAVFGAVWLLDGCASVIIERALKLALGALPAVALLGGYNFLVTGSPFLNPYSVLGLYREGFHGAHFLPFAVFYIVSLALFPFAGWAVLSPRWGRGWALPAASTATIALAALYYYRDGLNLESSSLSHWLGGTIPGQRFLLPVSFLACVPAARWLDSIRSKRRPPLEYFAAGLAGTVFVFGFWILSAVHQNYLRAHAELQQALDHDVPAGAQVVAWSSCGLHFSGCKELAPVYKFRRCIEADRGPGPGIPLPSGAYLMWAGAPGASAPRKWFANRDSHLIKARSWMWNSDIWLATPPNPSSGF